MEEARKSYSCVCVRVEHVGVVREKLKEIREKFRVSLKEVPPPKAKTDCGTAPLGLSVMFFKVEKSGEASQVEVSQVADRVQCFVDALCAGQAEHGDDSSYDSDAEAEAEAQQHGQQHHQDVSRTTSETLAAEYADYVTQGAAVPRACLEFGLRLGYTEALVRAALRRLGPSPAQNELLAELIRQASVAAAASASAARAPRHQRHQQRQPGVGAAAAATSSPSSSASSSSPPPQPKLRPIVIDGSNVAMSHGNKEVFSCRGLRLCVDWFRARGHSEITVFVPKWRKEAARPDNLVTEQAILGDLERERLLVYTPSRLVGGKRLVCYDDRYVLRLAADTGGVVVSNDNYRDLAQENAEFRKVVEERILMYSFVNDRFMPPDDPLGRQGPSLDQFLRVPVTRPDQPPPCPYARKCTYGNKCKFGHPERGAAPHKSVTERLAEQAQRQLLAAGLRTGPAPPLKGKSLSLPLDSEPPAAAAAAVRKSPLTRSQSGVPADNMLGAGAGAGAVAAASPASGCAAASNLHRPLQRQLSLNPTYDARLLQMRRAIGVQDAAASMSPPMPSSMSVGHLGSMAAHSGVTRIASAPDSYRSWTPQQQRASANFGSEPQLNSGYEWNQALYNQLQHQQQQQQQVRQRLHYHLASIFPEDLVRTAMSLYPDEADPQKICTAILVLQAESKP
ncbi:hypothetical protein ONE63_003033 [Megalurothrips usitatus]|uniref:C3H1-type domain-containing protein n=1 Tax=Megalurothrips usitatus TaxID=439358 RepID=A0AAV7X9I8_9NEOP|nr:hypothetical protein ONE63_003033 [Megalurothrips usitatus]